MKVRLVSVVKATVPKITGKSLWTCLQWGGVDHVI